MPILANNIKHAFNRAAQTYDQHCTLQQQTGNALLVHLGSHASSPKNIIDIGCGTGIHTEQLTRLYPHSEIYALDFADKLLQKAATRLTSKNVRMIEEDFDAWQGNHEHFDVIYSNLALHWSSNLLGTLNKLISLLNPNGVLAFSIPLIGTLEELSQKLWVREFYNEDICNQISSTILFSKTDVITLHYTDSLSALRSIKAVGANFVKPNNRLGLSGKTLLNKLKLTQLTYVIGYFVLNKM